MNDDALLGQLSRRIATGRIKVLTAESFHPPIAPTVEAEQPAIAPTVEAEQPPIAPTVEVEEEEVREAVAPESETQTWVDFQVLEDDTGEPVPGVELRIKLPDGTLKPYRTDANGMVHIADLTPGTCDIERMLDTDALEVVRVE